jgi:zinc protease
MRKVFALAAVLCFRTTKFSQANWLKKLKKKGTELVIPYEKYVFQMGSHWWVHEDHSDQVDATLPRRVPGKRN